MAERTEGATTTPPGGEEMREGAEQMREGARKAAREARERAREAGRDVGGRLNELGAEGMNRLGSKLNQAASFFDRQSRGASGMLARGEHVVAERFEDASRYLREKDPRELVTDLDHSIQRHPYRALFAGIAVGWVFGRMMRRG